MAGRVCAITGASSGLGLETARALAGMGATVALLCRSTERGEAARAADRRRDRQRGSARRGVRSREPRLGARRRRRAARRFDALHVLVNNAGLMLVQRRITVDGLDETFQVNHLSAFALTALLRERLEASAPARVVTVSSIAHRMARAGLRRSAERAPLRRLVRLRTLQARQRPVHVQAGAPAARAPG